MMGACVDVYWCLANLTVDDSSDDDMEDNYRRSCHVFAACTVSLPFAQLTAAANCPIPMNAAADSSSGPIPPELGRLTALNHLDLQRNRLTGEKPQHCLHMQQGGH